MGKKFKKMIIFNNPSSIKSVYKLQRLTDILTISFSIDGKIACDRKGIACNFPDEVIELPDLNKIGSDNARRVKSICDYLDKRLREKINDLNDNNLNLLSASYYHMKIFFDALYSSYNILKKMFEEVPADETIAFKTIHSRDNLIEDRKDIVPALLENVFLKQGQRISIMTSRLVECPESLISYLRLSKNHIKRFLHHVGKKQAYKGNAIMLHNSHEIPYLTDKILSDMNFYTPHFNKDSIMFRARDFSMSTLKSRDRNPAITRYIEDIFKEAAKDQFYREMFIDDPDLFHFANACLEEYIKNELGYLLSLTDRIKKWISDTAPELLLAAYCRLNIREAFLLELARSAGIPIVVYQEGGGCGYLNWPLYDLDATLSDYFLVDAEGVRNSNCFSRKSSIVPVGSIRLDTIKNTLKERVKKGLTIYVVLVNIAVDMDQHYPGNTGFFSQAYRHQLKILDMLRFFDGVRFVIKTLPGKELMYKRRINKFIRIETRPLADFLGEADGFILDWPSTILQECVLTNKPILLLYDAKAVDFKEEAMELLKKRIRISSDSAEFYSLLRNFIDDARIRSFITNEDDFLKEYCTMQNTEENLKNFFQKFKQA